MAGIGFGAQGSTYKTGAGNGLGPKTQIVTLTVSGGISQANLDSAIQALTMGGTYSGVANDAFTVAGISAFTAASTETVYVALQGTGTFTGDSSNALGVTSMVSALVATFNQNPA
jgi:hypothetical protein